MIARLRWLREEVRELTQDDVATRAGMSRAALATIEAGRRARGLSVAEMYALARALDIDPAVLVGSAPIEIAAKVLRHE